MKGAALTIARNATKNGACPSLRVMMDTLSKSANPKSRKLIKIGLAVLKSAKIASVNSANMNQRSTPVEKVATTIVVKDALIKNRSFL